MKQKLWLRKVFQSLASPVSLGLAPDLGLSVLFFLTNFFLFAFHLPLVTMVTPLLGPLILHCITEKVLWGAGAFDLGHFTSP